MKLVQDMMNHDDYSTTHHYVDNIEGILRDFPTDAKHSVFKNNVNRVQQANADVLKVLDMD